MKTNFIILGLFSLFYSTSFSQENALNFDGVNDYVSLDSIADSLAGNNEFTIEFWTKFNGTDNTNYGTHFSINTENGGNKFLIFASGPAAGYTENGINVLISSGLGASNNTYLKSTTVVGDNNCHHIAVTYTDSICKLYIDGILEGQITRGLSFSDDDLISLGQEYDSQTITSEHFTGNLDDIRIWKSSRTLLEINESMNSELDGNNPNLIAYFNCNQGTFNANNTSELSLTNTTNISGLDGIFKNFTLDGTTSNFTEATCIVDSTATENALHFDGINDYVSLDSLADSLAENSEFTIEFWTKYSGNDNTNYGTHFSVNTENGGNKFLIFASGPATGYTENGINILISSGLGPSNNTYLHSTTIVGDNNCHHIAVTYQNSICKLYIDGLFEGQITKTLNFSNDDLISLGQEFDTPTTTSEHFNGTLDDIKIWTSLKTEHEISDNMNSELTGNESGLLAYYHCNQGISSGDNTSETGLTNLSPINNLDGIFNNFTLNNTTSNFVEATCIIDSAVMSQNALHFNGTTNYVTLDSIADSLAGETEFTIEFWTKYNGIENTNYGSLFAINDSEGGNKFLIFASGPATGYTPDGINILISSGLGASNSTYLKSSTVVGDEDCHHIAVTYENSVCKLYVDGALKGQITKELILSNNDLISLGQEFDSPTTTSEFFTGALDDIRVWKSLRTQQEIIDNMNLELNGNEIGLIANYNCNQGISEGNNTLETSLTNSSPTPNLNGIFNDFTLDGATSNFIERTCEPSVDTTITDIFDYIFEHDELKKIIVYPNPSVNEITIKLSNYSGDVTGLVYDLTGKLVGTFIIDENDESIVYDISELKSGLYFITISDPVTRISSQIKFTKI